MSENNLRQGHFYNYSAGAGERDGFMEHLAHTLALTASVPMRSGIGIDELGYPSIAAASGLMMGAGWVMNTVLPWLGFTGAHDASLTLYGVAVFPGLALWQRLAREKEIKTGKLAADGFTTSVGNGRFRFLPIEDRFLGFVDPFVVLLVSALLYFRFHVMTTLGLWGMFAAVAFLYGECKVYRHCEKTFRAGINAALLARMRASSLGRIDEGSRSGDERPKRAGEAEGLSTGTEGLPGETL